MAESPFPIPLPNGFDFKKQSITLPNPKAGESQLYVHAGFPDMPNPHTSARFPKSAYDAFSLGLAVNPDGPCTGRRPWDTATNDWATRYEWETYTEVDGHRTRVGSALKHIEKDIGVTESSWKVGIWASNRPEWQFVSQACSAYSLSVVSLYDTLGPNVVSYCINHAETRVVFASPDHIPALLKLATECPTVKVIVSLDPFTGRFTETGKVLREWSNAVGIKLYGLDEFEAIGAAHLIPHIPPKPSDVASICYTSGTTGNPKGAILTHENLAAAVVSNHFGGSFKPDTVFISYLPLSHIYERFCEDIAFSAGCAIGYSCGDNLRLLEDIGILQPTYFISVPRVLNRVYQALKAVTIDAPGIKGKLLRKAFDDKIYNLKTKGTVHHAVYDRLLFKKIRAALGGRVTNINTGSAPIAPEVLDFLKVAFSCEVIEGYGQTENMGVCTKGMEGDHRASGTVGPPQPGVMLKLVDVPEMGYFSTDKPFPRGELCAKGAHIIPAYYKDEEKTKEAIDADGWLHSGDVATVDGAGRFKIIDRIKNLVKLSQGEYVALEKIENTYSLCPLIAQILVHGDSLQDHVVAIVVPDPVHFSTLASKATGETVAVNDAAAFAKAAKDPRVVKAVGAMLAPYAEKNRLLGYEKINSDILIIHDPFSVENGMMTPTFKTKRNVASERYGKELAALYAAKPKKLAKL